MITGNNAMATNRRYQSNRITDMNPVSRWSLLSIIILIAVCNSLPAAKVKKPTHTDELLLSGAISAIEDGFLRLKQYAKSLKTGVESTYQGDDDPLAESFERQSRDDDYRQEPELVPGLDRFEKNLEETSNHGKSASVQSSDSNDVSDISLQDFINFLRENIKGRNKPGDTHRATDVTKTTAAASRHVGSKDASLQDLLEYLKERQNQPNKDHADSSSDHSSEQTGEKGEVKSKTVAKDDANDLSLNDALEYLASLKQKLSEERKT